MKQLRTTVFILIPFMLLFCSCRKESVSEDMLFDRPTVPSDLVEALNANALNLQQLAVCYLKGDRLLACNGIGGRISVYQLVFESGTKVCLYSLEAFDDSLYPSVSMVLSDSVFLWTINNTLMHNGEGAPIRVDADTPYPELSFQDGVWKCSVGNECYSNIEGRRTQQIRIEKDAFGCFVIVSLPTGCILALPLSNHFSQLSPDVPNQAFYKTMFLDSGIGLTSRKRLFASIHLGLSLEGMSFSSNEDEELQNRLIEGEPVDLNGRLLYPDGQPRYQLLFVNGGQSKIHGQSLTDQARNNMRAFYHHGGSYVGTCAGAFFASNGDDIQPDYPYYLHIWPQIAKRTHLSQTYTGFFIEPDSPLLDYYDFGGDLYVDSVRHNGGCYADEQPPGGEVLARYDFPPEEDMHLQPATWAYKESEFTGRIVQIGSHPEEVSSGERLDFTEASILYAIDGRGNSTVKGVLQNGIRRDMMKTTLDDDPDFTMIGDLQCHHFMFYLPNEAVDVSVNLKSNADVDMTLMLNKETFAYRENAQYKSNGEGANCSLVFHELTPGLWFVGVQCNTTVTTTETDWGQEYSGRTDVLNGVPYSIKVNWTTPMQEAILQ